MSQQRHNLLRRVCLALVACLLATCVAQAAVTITGQVDPADPLSWTTSTNIGVGSFATDGALSIDGGSKIYSQTAILGDRSGVTGEVSVTGAGSAWSTYGYLYAGVRGIGTLTVQEGAVVNGTSSYLGRGSGSYGVATVTGVESVWANSGSLSVGDGGTGTLYIHDEATVTVGGETYVGLSVSGSGEIQFDQGTLHTGGLLAGVSQLGGVGTIYTRGLVTDMELTIDASHGFEQQLIFQTAPEQDITVHLDISGESNGYLGAGYKAVGSLNIADGLAIDSFGGYLGFHTGSQGTAIVTGAGSVWNNQRNVIVGNRGAGTLAIEEGARVGSLNTYIGAEGGSVGAATVSGVGSLLDTSGEFSVGRNGSGMLTIENGAIASNNAGAVGHLAGSNGVANVTGAGSKWINRDALYVGLYGEGTLTISDGAAVSNTIGGIGHGSGGVVTVTGAGSTWSNSSDLAVGVGGAATLQVLNGGQVSNVNGDINIRGALESNVLVSGAGSAWMNSGRLSVGAGGKGTLTIADAGLVSVGSGGGLGDVMLWSKGIIHLQDRGVLRLHGGTISGLAAAAFNFSGGRLEGVGTYQNGALTQNGGVLAPGNSAGVTTIVGSYILNIGALEIELLSGSGVAGAAFDRLVVNSGVTLGAESQLNLLLGYAANVGDSFVIVDSKNANPINGTFANDDALTAEFESLRYSFSLSYAAGTGNDIAVTVASVALIGDYNADGFVDAADYTVWQDSVGTAVAAYAGADGNGDGVVDDGDHAVWAAHYGASLEVAMAQAVPEPAGIMLGVLALAVCGRRQVGSGLSAS